jgi:hypothetical protein
MQTIQKTLGVSLKRPLAVWASAKTENITFVFQLDNRFERYLAQAAGTYRDLIDSPFVFLQ